MELKATVGFAGLMLLGGLTAGCAKPGAPSGGPEDTTPPAVLTVKPESLAVSVSPRTEILLRFSEKIEPKTLEKALWISPPRSPRSISVSGDRAVIHLRRALPESATVTVLLSTALKDRHRNSLAAPYQWLFATGPDLATGTVAGTVKRKGGGTRGQVLVSLFPVIADTLPDPRVEEPVAVTEAAGDGAYRLSGLATDGAPALLFAMLDRDGNREISGQGEFVSASPESVRLTPENPALTVNLRLVDPEAPGILTGSVTRSAGDTSAVRVALYAAADDSLATSLHEGSVAPSGAFSLKGVPPGGYRLIAYCDLNGSGRREDEELWLVLAEAVEVTPGDTRALGEFPGPRCSVDTPDDGP